MSRSRRRMVVILPVALGLLGISTLVRALVVNPTAMAPILYPNDPPDTDPPGSTVTLPDFYGDFTAGAPSSAQTQQANSLALSDSTVQQDLGGGRRYSLVLSRGYGPLVGKSKDDVSNPCYRVACIDLTYYVYTLNRPLDVFVNLQQSRVVRVEWGSGQPVLSDDEKMLAHDIAEADPEVQSRLAGTPHSHSALAYPMWWDVAPCNRDRCSGVLFLLDSSSTTGVGRHLVVEVDLTTQAVVDRIYLRCDSQCHIGW